MGWWTNEKKNWIRIETAWWYERQIAVISNTLVVSSSSFSHYFFGHIYLIHSWACVQQRATYCGFWWWHVHLYRYIWRMGPLLWFQSTEFFVGERKILEKNMLNSHFIFDGIQSVQSPLIWNKATLAKNVSRKHETKSNKKNFDTYLRAYTI